MQIRAIVDKMRILSETIIRSFSTGCEDQTGVVSL